MRHAKTSPLLLAVVMFLLGGCGTNLRPFPTVTDGVYPHAVVAADHAIASQAGLDMLRRGGNAVDAAVATSFCLAVVRPYSCGLGGGGFMLVHIASDAPMPSQSVAITYRETAPAAVGPDYYVQLDAPGASRYGPHAVGVPGTVAGLMTALENYGTLDRATVLKPAIEAAEHGFAIDADYVASAQEVIDEIREHPEWIDLVGADRFEWFYHRFLFDGEPKVGQTLRQPELARTLRLIARDGAPVFYAGEIGQAVASTCPQMSAEDLAQYEPRLSQPLRGTFRGRTVLAMPLPSSGGIATLETLGILDRRWTDLQETAPGSPPYIHLVVEAMKHAFADRAEWLGDERFANVPATSLISDTYLDVLARRIDPRRTQPPGSYGSREQLPIDTGTSHFGVVDQWGNAVACTETINLSFGSLLPVPEYGFMLNNEMDDFLTIPGERNAFGLQQSQRNLPEGGKWPLSSMSPTIVLGEDGGVEIVVGASGGPRIISATLQTLLDVVLHDSSAPEAVSAPRFHHQWMPDVLQFEDCWTDSATMDAMREFGHEIGRREDVGVVQLIRRSGVGWSAASDPRKGGAPAGW
ncbi:MAG: gamma-glutamyltransferase [Phycisphaerales bacterium]|nr:gamma-glutamyltransferase [Phycisphaerales bacterium]